MLQRQGRLKTEEGSSHLLHLREAEIQMLVEEGAGTTKSATLVIDCFTSVRVAMLKREQRKQQWEQLQIMLCNIMQ